MASLPVPSPVSPLELLNLLPNSSEFASIDGIFLVMCRSVNVALKVDRDKSNPH